MKYETLEKYEKELSEMENDLMEMEAYLEKHPESGGTKGNYETYKYVYNIFKEDKLYFINQTNKINLVLDGNLKNNSLEITDLYNLQILLMKQKIA